MVFRHRFLIDECLSPKLADIGAGIAEITHVNFRGLARRPDIVPARWCVERGYILVTSNGRDFRHHYAALPIHPGGVVLLPSVERYRQCHIFADALSLLSKWPDLINTLVEIDLDGSVAVVDWAAA